MTVLLFTLFMIAFFAFAMWIKAVAERNEAKYPKTCRTILFITALFFLPCDAIFNFFPGSLFFWELKMRGALFTTRLNWHKANSDPWSWRYRRAVFFCSILNAIQYKIMKRIHC